MDEARRRGVPRAYFFGKDADQRNRRRARPQGLAHQLSVIEAIGDGRRGDGRRGICGNHARPRFRPRQRGFKIEHRPQHGFVGEDRRQGFRGRQALDNRGIMN